MIRIKFELNIYVSTEKKTLNLKGKNATGTGFISFALQEIQKAIDNKSFSTSRNYQTAVRSLRKFVKQAEIPISRINAELIENYQKWLRQQGICLNTISCYMRSLRAVYNKAVEQSLTPQQDPFRKAFTGNTTTEKRSVSEADMRRVQQLTLKPGSFAELARDIFMFCFYALGMPFVDVAYLKKSQIKDDMITYYRHKTGQRIRINVEPCMQRIIKKYESPQSEYVFPIIHTTDSQVAHKQYLKMLGRYNRTLKSLARKAGVKKKLTSYVVRHTWASVAYSSNVDLPVISKALGHTDTKTTLVYIRELNDNRLAKANRRLLRNMT